nr:hypothetical protein [Tanacetum cinerariifolium]GEW30027.1 hypothetical protein [Tanacetum cinerariifolium]
KIPSKSGTRTRTAPATATATTPMTDAAIWTLIARGMADALAEQEIQINTNLNGDGSQGSRSGIMRPAHPTRKMKSVFHISNCAVENQVNFDTCTLLGADLTWRTFPEESDKVEKYVGGLPDMIQGSVMASKPKTMQDGIEITNDLINQKQSVAIAYTAGPGERKEYIGTLPLCNKCKFHHNGQCIVKYVNCKRVGHSTRNCRSPATNNQRTLTCYECGNQGNYMSDRPELKN